MLCVDVRRAMAPRSNAPGGVWYAAAHRHIAAARKSNIPLVRWANTRGYRKNDSRGNASNTAANARGTASAVPISPAVHAFFAFGTFF